MCIECFSSSGGTEDLDCGEMNLFSVDHQSFQESDSDLSLSASLSYKTFLHLRTVLATLFRTFLNSCQSVSKPVDLAFRYALFAFKNVLFYFSCYPWRFLGANSNMSIWKHSLEIDKIVDVMFSDDIDIIILKGIPVHQQCRAS